MSKVESANLILKLYETRREPVMREARNWFIGFFPDSAEEVMKAMINPETSAYYRMVTTYWDMAASFVLHEAIDEEMFTEITGEHVIVFSKIEPFLEEIRNMMQSPKYLSNLEKLVMKMPDAKETLAKRREMMRRMMEMRNQAAQGV